MRQKIPNIHICFLHLFSWSSIRSKVFRCHFVCRFTSDYRYKILLVSINILKYENILEFFSHWEASHHELNLLTSSLAKYSILLFSCLRFANIMNLSLQRNCFWKAYQTNLVWISNIADSAWSPLTCRLPLSLSFIASSRILSKFSQYFWNKNLQCSDWEKIQYQVILRTGYPFFFPSLLSSSPIC